jgi:hypothetical protein
VSIDVHGPVDFVIIEFDGTKMTGAAAAALLDLVDAGIIRIWDLLVVRKEADGTFSGVDINQLGADELGGFSAFAGARSGLLGDDDLAEAAEAMLPGTAAAVIVYENSWAIPFIGAAMDAGAQVVASARIPADVVTEALDALDAANG